MFVLLPHLRQQQRSLCFGVVASCSCEACVYTSTVIYWLFTVSSVLVHIVHYSHSCPVITTNRLQWNLSNAAPPLFMLLFLFRCRCACVKDEPGFKPKPSKQTTVKARRRSWGTVISAEMIHIPGGGAGAQTTDLPVG